MIDEPYRWVEAIANRREYIEHELASGSPTIAVSYDDGVLLLTFGRDRRKIFEIYDRIALGGIGHPGDIERLRIAAIELASTEGFTRSSVDVSVRRMTTYTFSPTLKQAFEQIYGAPYLARLLFAEVGRDRLEDFFVRLDYDGSMKASSMDVGKKGTGFGAISGTRRSLEQIEQYLERHPVDQFSDAAATAVRAWGTGLFMADEDHRDGPDDEQLTGFLREQLRDYNVEAAVLERRPRTRVAYRELTEEELAPALNHYLS
ncbi:MAG: hypothetical protein JO308_07775 [Verrucomicrobia bacterium]|nr:hypothetical protein [Verrucomicrobiota bacterium]